MDDVHYDSKEFTIQQEGIGLVVMERHAEPAYSPGTWKWSKWKPAGLDDLNTIIKLLCVE